MSRNRSEDRTSPSGVVSPAGLIAAQGPHPATALGIDLDAGDVRELGRWLVASLLLGGRTAERVGLDAFRRLEKDGLDTPETAAGDPGRVHCRLEEAGLPRYEAATAVLVRVCGALARRHGGSIAALASAAEGMEDLAGRLSQLGAGFGRAGVLRFLTPLRDRWSTTGDLPTSAAVLAAGRDLGWIPDTGDESGAPPALARAASAAGVPPRDLEAALDRLGRTSCLRGRSERCPLGARCPRRGGRADG